MLLQSPALKLGTTLAVFSNFGKQTVVKKFLRIIDKNGETKLLINFEILLG